jgi:predicted branched-subunit amino acid permease
MKKLALPLVINCAWVMFAFKILLGALQTQQPGRITAAAIGTAIPCVFIILLINQVIKLRAKQRAV